MDEYVLAALLRYKPISLCIVEPLYLSLSHTSNLSLGGLQAPVLPPSWRGYPPELEGKQKRRATWARAACVSISHNRYLTPFVPEPAGRMTCGFEQVNGNIILREARDGAGAVFCSGPPGNRDRETSRGPAGHDDVDLLGRRELGDHHVGLVDTLAPAVAHVRALAVVRVGQERPIRSPHGLMEVPLEIVLRPSALGERARVLGPHHQHRVGIQGGGPGRQSAARVKRWPGARLLVLTDPKRVASRMAERGHRDLTWPSAPDVDHQQPQRTADRRVRAVAGAEDSESAVEADAPTDRSVDDDERRREMHRCRDPMEVEGWIAGALAGGNDHRKIFGPTPGEHRVDRGLLDGQPPVVRRHFSEQFAWRASGTREHPFDALPGRRHDRESVGHAFVEPALEFVRRHRV